MEVEFKSFRKDMARVKNIKTEGGTIYEYEEALDIVRERLTDKLLFIMEDTRMETKDKEAKTKQHLRDKLKVYNTYISDIVYGENIRVRGFEEEKIDGFINEMVDEFGGYSVLSNAFYDPKVSDIYVLAWDCIFVERDGANAKYEKTFRSPKHFKDVLNRFVGEAGKEINNGDQKIVDFELYGDRGCATAQTVSPRDYSLTIRKHEEDHITRDELVKWNVLTEEMSDLLGLIIMGESNLIYGGLTGSGKTTTIRAILDYYVAKSNKRMLVCEDTQELFPKNEHTLQLVSVKSDDERLAVSLDQLIITALRLKPKYIVVGEIRGKEAQAAVEGMETGHSTIFTMHGGDTWNVINRLVTKYLMAMPSLDIKIAERIIGSSLDFVCIQDNIPRIGRRLTYMDEISFNFDTQRIEVKPIYRFNPIKKEFVFLNKISMEKADTMMRRGIAWEELEKWVETPQEKQTRLDLKK